MKLNPEFLHVCTQIAANSRTPLHWHFFSGMVGLHHRVTEIQIRQWIPEAEVHPLAGYADHLGVLRNCDLHLSTFPFGGTNTNLDSMHLGIPMITLEGRETHSQIDAGMIRRAMLPDWLVTRTVDEYLQTALRLIHSSEDREFVSKRLLKLDLQRTFMEVDARADDDFVEPFCWLYENHDMIQASGVRWWPVEQQRALSGVATDESA